ncbi:MAG: AEC family transporter [Ahrensia sp.]|nr:AEC family transporter [Ahrensia sp.]
MIEIVSLMLPIFTMIGMGALFVRQLWFPPDGLPVLNRFVMNVCIPVLLFSAVINGGSLATFSWTNAMVYGVSSLLASFLLWAVLRVGLGGLQSQSIILAMGAGAANSVFLGFPVASMILPERAAEIFSWVVFGEIAIVFPVITCLAQGFSNEEEKGLYLILRALVLNPVSLGLIFGFLFLGSGLSLPTWLQQVVGSIVVAAPFIALFVIGGTLLQFRISRTGPRVAAITFAKLIIHPLCVGAGFIVVFGWDDAVVREALLFASMPLFLSYVVFAARHDVDEVAASAIVLSTVLGAVSFTVLLGLLF